MGAKGLWTMLAGLALMALGCVLLAGGGSDDPNVFNEAMFNTRRLVVAPLVIVAGIGVVIAAIMVRPKGKKKEEGRP